MLKLKYSLNHLFNIPGGSKLQVVGQVSSTDKELGAVSKNNRV